MYKDLAHNKNVYFTKCFYLSKSGDQWGWSEAGIVSQDLLESKLKAIKYKVKLEDF